MFYIDNVRTDKDGKATGDYATFEAAEAAARKRTQNYGDQYVTKAIAKVEMPAESFKTTHLN